MRGEVHLLVGLIAPQDADLALALGRSKVMIEEMSSLSRFDAPATPRANGAPQSASVAPLWLIITLPLSTYVTHSWPFLAFSSTSTGSARSR